MRSFSFAVMLACGLLAVAPAKTGDLCRNRVSVALVLALDGSDSMKEEWHFQQGGYVAAFRSPEVREAILQSTCQRILVALFVWSYPYDQELVVPMRLLDSLETIYAFADEIEKGLSDFEGPTSVAGAVRYGVSLLDDLGKYEALQKVIDISGDGVDDNDLAIEGKRPSSSVYPPFLSVERAKASELGITINGLAIQPAPGPEDFTETNISKYYKSRVVTEDGFSLTYSEGADFATFIRRKLVLEIAGLSP